MIDLDSFYIDGAWRKAAAAAEKIEIVNPATAKVIGSVTLGNAQDVDDAVHAARIAFQDFGNSSRQERIQWLEKILAAFKGRYEEFVRAITLEMGAPITLSREAQAHSGIEHFEATIKALENFDLTRYRDSYELHHEPIGVCGLITPWNWPINQLACKVAPAIAAGCTMVLKPSEFSALSAQLFAEVIDESGLPKGVFNMIYGDGSVVGAAISQHADIDMVSFTGSTRAGIAVAQAAAPTVKRVSQELGGKSPIVLAEDVDLETVIPECVWLCMENTGQSCNAGTRLIVPSHLHDRIVEIAKRVAESYVVGDPEDEEVEIGPLANQAQYKKVQAILKKAEASGLVPVTGGMGSMNTGTAKEGFFVPPTIFANLLNDQPIASEEIFGPVLAILPCETIEDAIQIANDNPYGLSAYVYASDEALSSRLARNIRAGMIHINGAALVTDAPFGGYKQSGNGREWGTHGVHEFLEVKAVMK